jgi:hypothetical protein
MPPERGIPDSRAKVQLEVQLGGLSYSPKLGGLSYSPQLPGVHCRAMPGAHPDVLTGPCPCTDCRFAHRCAVEHLACEQFAAFAYGAGEKRWRAAPCAPRRALYLAVLGDGERKQGRRRKARSSTLYEPHAVRG